MTEYPRFRIEIGKRTWLMRIGVVIIVAAIIVAAFISLSIFRTVDVGYGVVLVDPIGRSISGPVIGPSWYLKAPWVNDVRIYYARDSVGMWKENGIQGDFPPIQPISSDGLRIEVDVLVRWSLKPSKLNALYQAFPLLDWKDKTIASVIREVARDVVGKYTAIQIIEERAEIGQALSDEITNALYQEDSLINALENVEVDLRDIDPPVAFLVAIENKLAAEQAKLQAEFEKERILTLANASATEQIIAAEGEAASRLIVAKGTADSIQIIAENVGMNISEFTDLYLTLEALKEIAKTTKNFVVIMGQDGLTYLVPLETEQPQ
jgi:regulator of protease activity HflC (stomatin/prohibitin superfamily)